MLEAPFGSKVCILFLASPLVKVTKDFVQGCVKVVEVSIGAPPAFCAGV
jgi:hypothetical protein